MGPSKWLITGGAGFTGYNTAKRLMDEGQEVIVYDNLSRKNAHLNIKSLQSEGKTIFIKGDVRDPEALRKVFSDHRDIDVVLHLAAQVAVTNSVINPREDFEINALGTFNVCEAIRLFAPETILLNVSTNKVYGAMEDLPVVERNARYELKDFDNGISETGPLDFHSPYGCSKGAADQYGRDYSRIYGLRTVTIRQSCIYGPHQYGIEDQGWVAWFTIAAILDKPVTIYGDGKQVRDILYIDDLIECYQKSVENIDRASGQIYNVGGGPGNTLSLLELIEFLENILGKKMRCSFAEQRPGDQLVFISDTSKAKHELNWTPTTDVRIGLTKLIHWVSENKRQFSGL
jgi:CDP-paratose 2-epimerase